MDWYAKDFYNGFSDIKSKGFKFAVDTNGKFQVRKYKNGILVQARKILSQEDEDFIKNHLPQMLFHITMETIGEFYLDKDKCSDEVLGKIKSAISSMDEIYLTNDLDKLRIACGAMTDLIK